MARTKLETIRQVTEEYLATLDVNNPPSPADVEGDILDNLKSAFDLENTVKAKNEKWKIMDKLESAQIASIVNALYHVILVDTGDDEDDDGEEEVDRLPLAIYRSDGPNKGIYVSSQRVFEKIAAQYRYGMDTYDMKKYIAELRRLAPKKSRCNARNLIAVNNGIFDYDTKQLLPFTPDLIFTSKSKVNYNPNAKNPVIHNPDDGTDWDVESWMADLSDDPEIVNVLWKILGAVIRPNVAWGKAAWLYSESGNNGKGTLCQLMRALCGKKACVSISLSDFSKDFMLEPLLHASAIIVDENDVGTYIDKAANLKSVVTGDSCLVNRKFKQPIDIQFRGFMVQCLNSMPKIRDKSDSFYRRQLFIPFTKCFTGAERKYIKQDYLHRQDVLEYVLYRVLNMNYYELDTPKACQDALNEYKEFNDPVRQFMSEIMNQLVWDLVPFRFLYDLYRAWYAKNCGGKGEMKNKSTFKQEFLNLLKEYPEWNCEDSSASHKTGQKMDKAEPLIAEYDLQEWMNPNAMGSHDIEKRCHPVLKSGYNGIVRVIP